MSRQRLEKRLLVFSLFLFLFVLFCWRWKQKGKNKKTAVRRRLLCGWVGSDRCVAVLLAY